VLFIYLEAGLIIFGLMTVVWLISLALRDASIVDIVWGMGFVAVAWLYHLMAGGDPTRKLLITSLATIWGLRLSVYIAWRNLGKGEDYRYRRWREEAGVSWWWRSYLQVFLLQGLLMWMISSPLLAAHGGNGTAGLNPLDYLGLLVWLVGFFFEAVGDLQLARFKSDPSNKGKLLTEGVWRYTRHPNYFGDAAQWWGFFLIAAAAGGWITVYSPILMTYLLLRVSGVAMLERDLQEKKPGYDAYIRRTNAFIPWFPKEEG
jgi:steroid 5-alpha reductase family enzyme